jgi:diguanylate cyclase (GGDEF)-like protein
MFTGTIVSLLRYFIAKAVFFDDMIMNASIFLILGFSFEFLRRLKLKTSFTSNLVSFLFAFWFLFIFFRLYQVVGPAVWTIALIQIIFAMSRIKKDMAYIIGLVTILASIYAVFNASSFTYQISLYYLVPQAFLVILLFLILSITHKINTDRFMNLYQQYRLANGQKGDITALYEELSATEEELRDQNEQLIKYTNQIIEGEQKLHSLAYYDVLTGLPNRTMFMDHVDLMIELFSKQSKSLYLVLIDVDSFKKVNDTMGHLVGDKYLLFATEHLNNSLKNGDILGRIGGDEFALLITRTLSEAELLEELEGIRNNFLTPFYYNNVAIRLSASFGVAVYPKDGNSTSSMLKSADMSMYKAKAYGKNKIQYFDHSMLEELTEKSNIENHLFQAIDKKEFKLLYQPQYDTVNHTIRGFEALIRWNSRELGFLSPGLFIPIAEETKLIIPIGEWVLRTACQKFKSIQDNDPLSQLIISVNISAVQIMDSNFIDMVKQILLETELNPGSLELEITESVAIESLQYTVNILSELKVLGVRIALDDFGTGYSSLNYLKILPIDILKIDKSFIDDLLKTDTRIPIVGDIISLAHSLKLKTIAEGVEYNNQLTYLADHSCDYIQGYLFKKPIPEDELDALFKQ